MELKLEDIKATILRLQGQLDSWTHLYQVAMEAEKKDQNEPTEKN